MATTYTVAEFDRSIEQFALHRAAEHFARVAEISIAKSFELSYLTPEDIAEYDEAMDREERASKAWDTLWLGCK